MNPAVLMKLIGAKNQFTENHPKFVAFLKAMSSGKIEEGTVIEVTVQKPGQDKVTANIKVQRSDLELLEDLKELLKQT